MEIQGSVMQYCVKQHDHFGGRRSEFQFPNGHGASAVFMPYSYGYDHGLCELAVIKSDGSLDYSTPITDDVLGYLTESQVFELLVLIMEMDGMNTEDVANRVDAIIGQKLLEEIA
jgi:hypothetical protein